MQAIAELREPTLVPDLIAALADGDEAVVTAAHSALVRVSCQDFGGDAAAALAPVVGGEYRSTASSIYSMA